MDVQNVEIDPQIYILRLKAAIKKLQWELRTLFVISLKYFLLLEYIILKNIAINKRCHSFQNYIYIYLNNFFLLRKKPLKNIKMSGVQIILWNETQLCFTEK